MKLEDKSWYKFLPPETEDVNKENFKLFFKTMFERQEIWYKRFILDQEAPWTKNKILRDYKFTNVYRELDRSSQWLIKNVLTDIFLDKEDLVFRILIYRFFNQPNTFDKTKSKYALELPHYNDFNNKEFWEKVVTYREKVDNPWQTAFLMNPGASKPANWNKRGLFRDDMYVNTVFTQVRKKVPKILKALEEAQKPQDIIEVLETILAVSSFMSHEFYLDFTYCARYWREPIMKFDQNDFTNVGPGCSTGLRLIFPSLPKKEQIEGIYWLRDLACEELAKIGDFKYLEWDKEQLKYYVTDKCNINLHQIEMWLCELQKIFKMQIGFGKQRGKFTPITKQL